MPIVRLMPPDLTNARTGGWATASLENLIDLGGDGGLGVQRPGHPARVVPVFRDA